MKPGVESEGRWRGSHLWSRGRTQESIGSNLEPVLGDGADRGGAGSRWPFVAVSRAVEDNRKMEQGSVGMEIGEVRARTKAGELGRYQKSPALVMAPARCSRLLASNRKRLRAKIDEKRPRAEADGPSALPEAALVNRGGCERGGDGAGAGPST